MNNEWVVNIGVWFKAETQEEADDIAESLVKLINAEKVLGIIDVDFSNPEEY